MRIRIGHSADPDDAFMAWALVSGRVDPRGFEFEFVPEDIQVLNEWALDGKLEVTALSLATYPLVQDAYALLPHGASIGSGYGPIVVAQRELSLDELGDVEVVVPGRLTTAFLVLGMALGGPFAHRALPFDRISVSGGCWRPACRCRSASTSRGVTSRASRSCLPCFASPSGLDWRTDRRR
jgi:5,8-dihydroxy-2-naphthoate synthase